jgi:putative FmdB family regulatory protein
MPIYEYECKKCKKVIEKCQKFSDPHLTACTFCGGELKKLISNSSFQLKGSGWYVTDYCDKNTKTTPSVSPKSNKDNNSVSSSTP